jgi:hypothetical protein
MNLGKMVTYTSIAIVSAVVFSSSLALKKYNDCSLGIKREHSRQVLSSELRSEYIERSIEENSEMSIEEIFGREYYDRLSWIEVEAGVREYILSVQCDRIRKVSPWMNYFYDKMDSK